MNGPSNIKMFPFIVQMKIINQDTQEVSYDPTTPAELSLPIGSEPWNAKSSIQCWISKLFQPYDEMYFKSPHREDYHFFDLKFELGIVFQTKKKEEPRKIRMAGEPSEYQKNDGITLLDWFNLLMSQRYSDDSKVLYFVVLYTRKPVEKRSKLRLTGYTAPPPRRNVLATPVASAATAAAPPVPAIPVASAATAAVPLPPYGGQLPVASGTVAAPPAADRASTEELVEEPDLGFFSDDSFPSLEL
jgi:hypothetical protein